MAIVDIAIRKAVDAQITAAALYAASREARSAGAPTAATILAEAAELTWNNSVMWIEEIYRRMASEAFRFGNHEERLAAVSKADDAAHRWESRPTRGKRWCS